MQFVEWIELNIHSCHFLHQALCSLRSGDEGVLMNVVQMLSYFGRLLVNSDDKELLCREEVAGGLQQTTNFILDLCVSDGRLPVMATCLDVIIDLYTEDNTHVLAHHCRLLERLRGAYTKFMQAYRKVILFRFYCHNLSQSWLCFHIIDRLPFKHS